MSALDVLPLAAAKLYLNIPASVTKDDVELQGFIAAAVGRVDRHLYGDAAEQSLADDPETVTPLQLLAVKAALAEFWETQRVGYVGGSYGGGTAAAAAMDTGPSGVASLTMRLTELLGPPAGDASTVPRGSFPAAAPWPDPICVRARVWP